MAHHGPGRHHPPARRLALWLTLWLMVAATLAPGLARAAAAWQGANAPWQQLCVATAQAADGSQRQDSASHALDHCPMCQLQQHSPAAPPPVAGLQHAAPALAQAMPALWLQARTPLFAWAGQRSRAPPAAG